MIKIIKTRFLSNLDSGCIRTDPKSYVFTNLIIQIYKHRNQISKLEMLKSKLA